MNWDFDSLWAKAKYYSHKSVAEPPGNQEVGLYAAFALEFLGRASLAKIHSALLADPRDGRNMLAVFGYVKDTYTPKSIPVATVFERCSLIVSPFLASDVKFATGFVERRNEELHGGDVPFADYDTANWLATYYAVADKLCTHCGGTLDEYIGDAVETATARAMIVAAAASVRTQVERAIATARAFFEGLTVADRLARTATQNALAYPPGSKKVACPACGADAVVSGPRIKTTPPRLVDEEILTEETYLPESLICGACNLSLLSHADLHAIGLGGQFHEDSAEPANEYYERVYRDDVWDDYGND